MSLFKPQGGLTALVYTPVSTSTRHTGALDKQRCGVCGKLNPTYEHLTQCAEDAAQMNALGTRNAYARRELRK